MEEPENRIQEIESARSNRRDRIGAWLPASAGHNLVWEIFLSARSGFNPSRRGFVQTAGISAAGALLAGSIRPAALAQSSTAGRLDNRAENFTRIDEGWEFHLGPIADPANAWASNAGWSAIALPHCFNAMDACDPDRPYYRGQAFYRARIPVRNPHPGGRTILYFQGAGQTTTVWAAGKLIGTHKGGYGEFVFDIADAIASLPSSARAAGVPVAVCCDNSPDRDRIPSELSDFCLYGGLYRQVNLVCVPSIALDMVHIRPALRSNGQADIRIVARLYNPLRTAAACRFTVEIRDPAGRIVQRFSRSLETGSNQPPDFVPIAAFTLDHPQLWSPRTPNLYRCRIALATPAGEMEVEERFGIRHVEFVAGGPFRLNGERLLLRGTQRHADHAGLAAAMPDDLVRQELSMIREMGANFLRLAHYQQDRLVLQLCDELGILVWEELPWCRSGAGGRAFRQNAHQTLASMIEQHYNHPSIVFWGLANEIDWPGEYPSIDKQAIRGLLTELHEHAHRLDDTRLTAIRRCDFARDIPDVYSPSIWAGWYGGQYREYEQSLIDERRKVQRFIHIEWGADSHAGRHSEDPEAVLRLVAIGGGTDERAGDALHTGGRPRVSSDGDWSETYACNLFDWHLKTQEQLDWLSGSAQWIFKDFASPLRDGNGIPRVNQKGVVERDLTKKESYYVFQSYWAEKPMVHIYGHTWPVRWGAAGQQRSVRVYSNCDRAELFLNGVSQGTRERNSQDFPAAGLRWSVCFAPGKNHLRAVAWKGPVTVVDEIDLTYQTERWGKPASLRLSLCPSQNAAGQALAGRSRVTVKALLYDSNGVLCLDAQRFVRFSLSGAGRLIDNLGTTRASRQVQLANGRARISAETYGPCVIEARIEGLPAASIKI